MILRLLLWMTKLGVLVVVDVFTIVLFMANLVYAVFHGDALYAAASGVWVGLLWMRLARDVGDYLARRRR